MLKNLTHMHEDNEEGFSLVELLVVIVIIGILSSIAIGAFLNQRKKANDAAVESDMRSLINVVEPLHVEYYDPSKDANGFAKQIQLRHVSSTQFNNPEDPRGTGMVEIQIRADDNTWETKGKAYLSDGVKAYLVRHNSSSEANAATTDDGYAIWMYHTNGSDHTLDSPLRYSNQMEGGFYELPND